jgi:hypothetical protein
MQSDDRTRRYVRAIHAEGPLEAEKMMIARVYDGRRALDYAKQLAGLA